MADLGISGLASGFDWRSFVNQMVEVERAPQQRLLVDQNLLQQKKNAYGSIQTQLAVLQNRVNALKDPGLFEARGVQVGSESTASATVSTGAPVGKFTFNFTQLATSAKLNGASGIGAAISATNDVSGVPLSSAGFSTAITAGTITVNGKQVTIDGSGSLQDVFNAIETATGGDVTASYDSSTDRITLNSASEIVLGSATDTSNFLKAARLYNNGSGVISSSSELGGVKSSAPLANGNFTTAINDGGEGKGKFKINGVEISFSATADSLQNVIDRINNSEAGVVASYDSTNDRLVLANKNSGDVGIAVEDMTGNFAAATGLTGGTLERGQNLLYTINGGGTLVSESNTITESSSGLAGLNVTALEEGSTSITVSSDTSKIKTAITDFITEYNKAQSILETQTASSTDGSGAVTSGTLAGESDASDFASLLRSKAFATISGFAATMNQLEDIGIITNGNDNSLKLDDEQLLDEALANNLSGVKKLFTDSKDGLAVSLSAYVDSLAGDDGKIETKQNTIDKEIASINTQISDLERVVQSNKESLIQRFITMETTQAQINQQLQFLQQRFGASAAK